MSLPKFVTNNISVGNTQSFSSFVEKMTAQNPAIKTASKKAQADALKEDDNIEDVEDIKDCTDEDKEANDKEANDKEANDKEANDKEANDKEANDKEAKTCDEDDEEKEDTKDCKKSEASILLDGKFTKIANLSDKEKTKLRSYYEMYYPKDFVDALIADK